MKFWLARDRGGDCYCYLQKPVKSKVIPAAFMASFKGAYCEYVRTGSLLSYLDLEVTHENSPKEFEIKEVISDENERLLSHKKNGEKEGGNIQRP